MSSQSGRSYRVRNFDGGSRVVESRFGRHWLQLDRGLLAISGFASGDYVVIHVPLKAVQWKVKRSLDARRLIVTLLGSFALLIALVALFSEILPLFSNETIDKYDHVAGLTSLFILAAVFVAGIVWFFIPRRYVQLHWWTSEEKMSLSFWFPNRSEESKSLANCFEIHPQGSEYPVEAYNFSLDWRFTRPFRVTLGATVAAFLTIWVTFDFLIRKYEIGIWAVVIVLIVAMGSAVFTGMAALRLNRGRGRAYLDALDALVARNHGRAEMLGRELYEKNPDDPQVLVFLEVIPKPV